VFKSKAEAAGYLAGLIDGEGTVSARKTRSQTGEGFVRDVRITNTDPALLDAARAALDLLGVEHYTHDRSERECLGTKPIFEIIISRKANLESLASQITLRSVKAERLRALLDSYVRPGVPPEAELRSWVEAGESDALIAKRFNVTPGAVWGWRKKYGVVRAGS
jgi:hypothetical protein